MNAQIEINSKYEYVADRIRPGETLQIGMMNFADSDGQRLLPSIKPGIITIYCYLELGGKGYLYSDNN